MTKNLPETIDLDLDALEKPNEEQIPAFRVNINGRVVEFTNPDEIDWLDLVTMESPTEFLKHCVPADDRDFLLSASIPGWKFKALMKAFQRHYKIDDAIERARREQRLSGSGF